MILYIKKKESLNSQNIFKYVSTFLLSLDSICWVYSIVRLVNYIWIENNNYHLESVLNADYKKC